MTAEEFDRESHVLTIRFRKAKDIALLKKYLEIAQELEFASSYRELIIKLAPRVRYIDEIERRAFDRILYTSIDEPKRQQAQTQKKEAPKKLEPKDYCEQMGGTVIGNSCRYIKYEIIPGGDLKKWERTTPLPAIDEQFVKMQYSPSREAVEDLLAKQAGK